jgi:non-homologous end joining protein Ku
VYPEHGGLMVTCLSYANTFQQVIDGAAAFDDVQANPAVAGLFGQLIEAKLAGPEALDEYRDDLIDLRADLIERVKMGESLTGDEDGEPRTKEPVPTTPSETDRLLATLEASVAEVKARKAKAKTKPRASTRKTSASKQRAAARG